MKKRFNIYIHPLYYLVAGISFFTGYFKAFSIYTIIILIHELGHIFAGLILKWPISKVTIYPFGCMTTFNNKLNSSVYEEFLILIYGPLFQILFNMIYPTSYHYIILLFNLLPIYPLDGSKIIFLLFNKIFSYYNSYIYIFTISYITIFILLINHINFISWIILLYVLYDVIKYNKMLKSIMLKFLYERYKYKINYRKNKYIKGVVIKKMSKEKNNYFYTNGDYINEYYILSDMFERKF